MLSSISIYSKCSGNITVNSIAGEFEAIEWINDHCYTDDKITIIDGQTGESSIYVNSLARDPLECANNFEKQSLTFPKIG